jgi:hypothetical protein
MDWFDRIVGLVWLLLTYQQNQILRAGNPPPQGTVESRWLIYAKKYWPMFVMVLLGVAIWLPRIIQIPLLVANVESLHGTADIPSNATQATIPLKASLPYTLHGLTPDWSTGVFVTSKHSGNFSVAFNVPAPEGGGSLDWEVIPRAGARTSAIPENSATPSALASPLPEYAKYSNAGNGWPQLPLSDADKWHFAQWMKSAGASDPSKPNGCTIVFVRYEEPAAEDLVASLGEILEMANWKHQDRVALGNFPKGLTVLSSKLNDNCAINFSNGVRQFAGIQVANYPYKQGQMSVCGNADCVEVQVGNVPNPK